MEELAGHRSILKISKFGDPDGFLEKLSKAGASSEEIRQIYPERFLGQEEHEGNILVNVGIQGLWKLAFGLAAPPGAWSKPNAKLRTGIGCGAAAAGDTQATFTNP